MKLDTRVWVRGISVQVLLNVQRSRGKHGNNRKKKLH